MNLYIDSFAASTKAAHLTGGGGAIEGEKPWSVRAHLPFVPKAALTSAPARSREGCQWSWPYN